MRKELASLTFGEKIKILDKLRKRSLAIAASRKALKLKKAQSKQSS